MDACSYEVTGCCLSFCLSRITDCNISDYTHFVKLANAQERQLNAVWTSTEAAKKTAGVSFNSCVCFLGCLCSLYSHKSVMSFSLLLFYIAVDDMHFLGPSEYYLCWPMNVSHFLLVLLLLLLWVFLFVRFFGWLSFFVFFVAAALVLMS